MALMTFDIPDGMTAQVIVGSPDTFARREPMQISFEPIAAEPRHKRRSRWVLLSCSGVILLVGGMILGGSLKPRNVAHAETAMVAPPIIPQPVPEQGDGPAPATTAFPSQPPSAQLASPPPSLASDNPPAVGAPTAPTGQLPPDLAADLKAQPQVEAAPGQAPGQAGAPPSQNAFGLGN
jgi:hypothetical protein